jgi:cytochrome c peroxidase/FtsP/CotA-like multicopper oxidase with cupredoxin domain
MGADSRRHARKNVTRKDLPIPRRLLVLLLGLTLMAGTPASMAAPSPKSEGVSAQKRYEQKLKDAEERFERVVTQEERDEASANLTELIESVGANRDTITPLGSEEFVAQAVTDTPGPGDFPDYSGMTPNWAYSPPLRKFVDSLPGLGPENANNLGQYMTVAKPDTITYPGCDYYEIELREYTEQLHSDMPPTTLRGYVQVNNGTDAFGNNTIVPDPIHYLGATIFAKKDRPVRVKFTNALPTGSDGDLFIPVDTSVMGAGMGPLGENVPVGMPVNYTQNRASVHLHGGRTPWISDGTPHQWITPAGENTPYPEGVSVENVPDMPAPGDGSQTFYYTNAQSARLMWYHDHAFGITRLNVYAGMASAYLISDSTEEQLIADGTIPEEQIPLVIQDKTFVDAETIVDTDPTWRWGTGSLDASGYPVPKTGDLWMPHVYMPAQNPYDPSGYNAMGRWHYGPWFWPPTPVEVGPIANPYYDPINAPWQPEMIPGVPDPSMGMEAFFDTPIVNGTAYPTLEVDPKSYRFRILNAANDRFWNLQLYQSDPTPQAVRTFGADRYATAAQSAMLAYPNWTGVQHVILTSGEDASQVDALSGSGLAGAYDAPLLLTRRGWIPPATLTALQGMPDGVAVHIVGGTPSVTSGVASAIAALPNVASVDRLSGANRYTTAAAVAARMESVLGTAFPTGAFIVNGSTPANFYDSLVAGPAAVQNHFPILLVRNDSVPAPTLAAITDLGITTPYIVGGTPSVSAAVATQLGVLPGNRIAGANRFATAVAFAIRAKAEGWLEFATVGIAASTVDALSGGVSLGHLGGPMLLTRTDSLPQETLDFLTANKRDILQGYVFGGSTTVSQQVLDLIIDVSQNDTEVKMVPAAPSSTFPENWPADGRDGGVPDPATAGPDMVQIANEGGFLPAPVVLPSTPLSWNMDVTTFNAGLVEAGTLMLGPAERADVVIDFSKYAGKTLILFNDAPAPWPSGDPRYDYYTGAPDYTEAGGHEGSRPGYGPNVRTIMQIKVAAAPAAEPFDIAALEAAFKSTDTREGVFQSSQEDIIVSQSAYNSAYNKTFSATYPDWGIARIFDNSMTFRTVEGTSVTIPFEPKAIQDEMGETFDKVYGRMSGKFGLEVPNTVAGLQNFNLYDFMAPPTELIEASVKGSQIGELGDGTQIWKITQNGVDTHPVHFHLFEVQLLNRVAWDNRIMMPDPNELGWKETVRVNPLEDTIVALRAVVPEVPFDLPNSVRPMDPTMPLGMIMYGPDEIFDPSGEPVSPVVNRLVNFGYEYMMHCHILSHEEMDMMRPVSVGVTPKAPSDLSVLLEVGVATLSWTDNSANETGFVIERAADSAFTSATVTFSAPENATSYDDETTVPGGTYYYRVHATNVLGDTTDYTVGNPQAIGFPTMTLDSDPTNAVTIVNESVPLAAFEALGKQIFFDTNLSDPVGQACASCHDPATGFADPGGDAISPGAVPGRFANRNAPMAAYAAYIPPFSFDAEIGAYVGGQFWDGRSDTLKEQAGFPFLNPLEMNMADEVAVVEAVAASTYAPDFLAAFGPGSLDTADAPAAFDRITAAIGSYERGDEVSPFTSKHDYAMTLSGDARFMVFTMQERLGMSLFNGKAKCWECHTTPMGGMPLMDNTMAEIPNQLILFSDYRYSNLGIPKNPTNPFFTLPVEFNPDGVNWIDHGLAAVMPGGVAANPELDGMFKTPSLRNVALTAPYGHNGTFATLKDIVHFYNTRDVASAGWPEPEVAANVDTVLMGDLGLTDAEENAIVAFLGTLSDGTWTPPAP